MKKIVRIVLIIAVWATVTWIFREKLLPMPKPDPAPPPHFRSERGPSSGAATSPAQAGTPAVATSAEDRDDLQEVKGIGPVYEHRLTEIGITNFEELVQADPAQVAERIDVTEAHVLEWIDQARDLNN